MSERKTALIALVALFAGVTCAAQTGTELTDPGEILMRHYDAVGGFELIAAEETRYFEGSVSIAGLTGSVRQWYGGPGRHRTEVDLGVFRQTVGDNGEVAWELDTNGKLRIEKDEIVLQTRDVERRLEGLEYIDPDSDVFTVTLEAWRNRTARAATSSG